MTLVFIDQDKLSVSKTNMRYAKKAPDVSDILPTVRKRGVIQTLLVRPAAEDGHFEIVAGSRRFHAAKIVAEETGEAEPLPCRVLAETDDVSAIEASMIENVARLDADEVNQWETFTRLVKEGREVDDIAATFGLPDLTIRRVLALGNLLPRIRGLYRAEEIDRATVKHLTLASKSQQTDWLKLYDDPDDRAPTGQHLKSWLLGGQSIAARFALFNVEESGQPTIADLFGEDRYFADPQGFWTAQNEAVAAAREAYLAQGWAEVVVVPANEHFQTWEHEKVAKRKGGRVYIDVRSSGEVTFHEGYVTRLEARRATRGEAPEGEKPKRGELTSALQDYVNLHRHAATRAALLSHPGVALRLMVAHAVIGSHLWTVRPEPQSSRNELVSESIAMAPAEALFDERRAAVLGSLGHSRDDARLTGGNGDEYGVTGLFLRLMAFDDHAVMAIVCVIMGETLASGSAAVDAAASVIGVDMADWLEVDDGLFENLRDREVLTQMVAEVAGETVAKANAGEKSKTLKGIIRAHLEGSDGRAKVERWVPRWMAFPPSAYTTRGGIESVRAHAKVMAAREALAAEQLEESEEEPGAADMEGAPEEGAASGEVPQAA